MKDWNKLKGAFIKRFPKVTKKGETKDALSVLYTIKQNKRDLDDYFEEAREIYYSLYYGLLSRIHICPTFERRFFMRSYYTTTQHKIGSMSMTLFFIRGTEATSIRAQNEMKLCTTKSALIYPTISTQLSDNAAADSDRKNQRRISFQAQEIIRTLPNVQTSNDL